MPDNAARGERLPLADAAVCPDGGPPECLTVGIDRKPPRP